MLIKVNEAANRRLNWAVALAMGKRPSLFILQRTGDLSAEHHYSTDWAQGGPIIDLEIGLIKRYSDGSGWYAQVCSHTGEGPTPLIAAMRCYVVSKLGEEVEVPDELS